MDVSAVDFFCGAGGLTYGFETAGIPVTAGVDIDPECRYPYETNTNVKFVEDDVARLATDDPETVTDLFDESADTRILTGCAPCQPFSPFSHGGDSSEHAKWELLRSFGTLVEDVEPEIVVMENVYEVRLHEVYEEFVETLEMLGYYLNTEENMRVHCPSYGIPQKRKRWVLLASKRGPIELLSPREFEGTKSDGEWWITLEDRIGPEADLPPIAAGEVAEDDQLHRARGLTDLNLSRIRKSSPGGTWRDWPEKLVLDCHKRESGRSYDNVYGRMEWDEPASTITTQFYNYGTGRYGHPEQERALSLREGAMLQTFPRDYEFVPEDREVSMVRTGRWIGNAVPPRLGEAIGVSVLRHLRGIRQMTILDYVSRSRND